MCWAPVRVLADLDKGMHGSCAKIPSAECSVMSKRVPIGWKDVDKQEHMYIDSGVQFT